MFDNIDNKIKNVAQVICWLGIVGSVIYGLVYIISTEFWDFGIMYLFIGVAIMAIGSLLSWASSLVLYGFGELIEKVSKL